MVTLEARPANVEGRGEISIRDLVRNSLRMRPDRIIVGEVRGGETLDMLQALNTGHEGSLVTVHANSCDDAIHRLETLATMSDLHIPFEALRDQINSAIHVIVQIDRYADGARRITEVAVVASSRRETFRLATVARVRDRPDRPGPPRHRHVPPLPAAARHRRAPAADRRACPRSSAPAAEPAERTPRMREAALDRRSDAARRCCCCLRRAGASRCSRGIRATVSVERAPAARRAALAERGRGARATSATGAATAGAHALDGRCAAARRAAGWRRGCSRRARRSRRPTSCCCASAADRRHARAAALFVGARARAVVAFGVTFGVARTLVERKRNARREEFIGQLPELARVLSNGTSAGLSMPGAVQLAARELSDPPPPR